MTFFDRSQQRVLDLDPRQHARVLGAPGSGKTKMLVESFIRSVDREGWSDDDVLVLAPSRLVAAQLRGHIERKLRRAMGGAPVRTGTSLAFSLLARSAAVTGSAQPRLLTGQVLDDAIAEVVQTRLDAGQGEHASSLSLEVLLSAPFRAELRELWRVVDDFGFAPSELAIQLSEISESAQKHAFTVAPEMALSGRWIEGLSLLHDVSTHLAATRADELSPSALLRNAKAAILRGEVAVPRLLLVDDAQDLGEGELALLAACATVGSSVWVFGDPDAATGAFQGEGTRVLAGLTAELQRRGWSPSPNVRLGVTAATTESTETTEATIVLETVYRHGPVIRELVRGLSDRIGAAGGGLQRIAVAADPHAHQMTGQGEEQLADQTDGQVVRELVDRVQFARIDTPFDQLGVVAHRMRALKLGLEQERDPLNWNEMAVVCRTRGEAVRVARLLAGHQVPTGVTAGGVVLREHQIVRELITLVQHVLGLNPLDATGVLRLAGGVVGGLDPVAVRRLRSALLVQERRDARAEGREPDPIEDVVFEAFKFPGSQPVIDSAGGRTIRRLGLLVREAVQVHAAGGTAREVLWALWDGTKLAERWQHDALVGRGQRSAEAGRALDAVMGLFFVLQRHEEQDSKQPISEVLDEMLRSTVPEDTLAQQSGKQTVTVTTPQGVVGREFAFVAVLGPQEGTWPNLRARGSLLGTAALERWLRGGEAQAPSRRDTIHDELRLFLHACSRAREELLVVAVADEDNYPSPFFGFGKPYEVTGLPSARLTLRGVTAAMRRRLVTGSEAEADSEQAHDNVQAGANVLESLAALAAAGVPGAHPDEWYGVLPPSSVAALYTAAEGEEPRQIPVSPSQLERAETCALDWVISSLGGGAGSMQASLGTLVHHALETAEGHDPERILEAITAEWRKLPFDAEWESERARRTAAKMAAGLADYLSAFAASGKQLLGRESSFSIDIGRATLRGVADRLELNQSPEGAEITVIDLKTGRTPVSGPGAEEHVQLQAYQLGVALGAFEYAGSEAEAETKAGPVEPRTAAKLLYVHPDATRGKGYVERVQSEFSEDAKTQLSQRVTAVAETMAAGEFTARIEHHCSDPHQPGNCRLHIIQAVSHA